MDEIFTALSHGLEASPALAVLAALGWGLASVALSPCHLVSVPVAIGYLRATPEPRPTSRLSVVLAVTELAALAVIGAVTVAAGRLAGDLWGLGTWIAAALLIVAGLALLDVIPLPSGGIRRQVPRDLRGAAALGATLGVTLGPCTFAFMAPVLAAAMVAPVPVAVAVVLGFALGHLIATFGAGVLGSRVSAWLRSGKRLTAIAKALVGVGLVGVALSLIATAP
ncbi:MAG: cytochrome C biogenesis protein [Deltaproteobacteria bacterium]|nr:MAG: cytochrome C biogenesis protein [Deltaproteobacteria bacterium]